MRRPLRALLFLGPVLWALGLPSAGAEPASPSASSATHPFSVQDLVVLERISDPQVSPDGKQAVFVLRSTDLAENKGRFDLWLVRTDGTGLRRLTTHPAPDTSPRWSADGKAIFFLSSRSGSSQVWRIELQGGEAVQVSDLPTDVDELLVVPGGNRLLLAIETYPDCRELACTVQRDEEKKGVKASGRIYDRLFVRHWDAWSNGKRRHLFSWVPGGSAPPVDLMAGVDADCPSKPWGGPEEVAIAPDGKEVVYTAKVAGREEAWSTDFNLWRVPVDGTAAATCLTCANKAWDTLPAFSPDGRTLAYLAMARPGYESDRLRLRLLDRATGKVRELADDWDRSPWGVVWSRDGKRLFAVADNLGQTSLFAIDAATGKVSTLVTEGHNALPELAEGDRLLFARDSLLGPAELYSVKQDGRDLRQLTRINEARMAQVRLGEPEQFTFTGARGDTVHGYLVKPVDHAPGKRYPIAFLIHGGPQGSFGNSFHYRWNPQTYAGAGYAALMIDFHGSTGYGQAFTDAINGDWGGAPYEDLMKGLDAALARYPFLDGERACALGASYGGYMIYWIAGQTDRFRCLVAHDGNLDERMAYFDTEELWFPEWEHQGTPWDDAAGYGKHNPVDHVGKWRTPMLVVHGGLDFRVVETQGLGAFNALQRRGIPSKLLYFPDENHWVLQPHNSILWHDTVNGWLDQWLKE